MAIAYSLLCLGRQAGSTPAVAPTLWPVMYRGMLLVAVPGGA